eukprot:187504_1
MAVCCYGSKGNIIKLECFMHYGQNRHYDNNDLNEKCCKMGHLARDCNLNRGGFKNKNDKCNNEEKTQNKSINLLKISYEKNNNKIINEKWNKNTLSDEMTIHGNKILYNYGGDGPCACAFGTEIIKSGINIWRFKIEKGNRWFIGIINAEKVKEMSQFHLNVPDSYSCCGGNGYSFNQKKAIPNNNGLKFDSGDILVMCLNMNNSKLLYSLNRQPFKTIFHNINTSIKYKMAICCYGSKGNIIKLECFMHYGQNRHYDNNDLNEKCCKMGHLAR